MILQFGTYYNYNLCLWADAIRYRGYFLCPVICSAGYSIYIRNSAGVDIFTGEDDRKFTSSEAAQQFGQAFIDHLLETTIDEDINRSQAGTIDELPSPPSDLTYLQPRNSVPWP